MRNPAWVVLVLTALAIKGVAAHPFWVEHYYSRGFFPVFSLVQRWVFGWIPFSLGDWLYAFLLLIIFFKTGWLIRDLWHRKVNRAYCVSGAQQAIFFFLSVYVFFNLCWGLNYSRAGIGYQLGLTRDSASVQEVEQLTRLLLQKATLYRYGSVDGDDRAWARKRQLFAQSRLAYAQAAVNFPFLRYTQPSVKPSLYSYLGNYLGFQGYYNPFSGEAQVNTTIPLVLQPFVSAHELAHQLGYAKESEANFVGYLAGKHHPSPAFRYSVYLDMFRYAYAELYRMDSARAAPIGKQVPPLIKNDIKAIRSFYLAYSTPIERVIMQGYDYFLQANDQPQGTKSYNQVVGWLTAWVRKHGTAAL